jgi:hypothetical protein
MHNKLSKVLVLGMLFSGLAARAATPDTIQNLPPRLKDFYGGLTVSRSNDAVQSSNASLAATNAVQSATSNARSGINGLGGIAVLARERNAQPGSTPALGRQSSKVIDSSPLPSPITPEIILIVVLTGGMAILFRKMETD